MKTIEITLYKFEELSSEAQENAINKNSDFNVDFEWWDGTYDDANNVGIKITEFDVDRASYCKGYIADTEQTAHDIIKQHGENCETYKTAAQYLKERDTLIENWPKDSDGEYENEDDLDDQLDELGEDFEQSILEDYRIILSNEYEYLTSAAAIKEALISNDYDFTAEGEIY